MSASVSALSQYNLHNPDFTKENTFIADIASDQLFFSVTEDLQTVCSRVLGSLQGRQDALLYSSIVQAFSIQKGTFEFMCYVHVNSLFTDFLRFFSHNPLHQKKKP